MGNTDQNRVKRDIFLLLYPIFQYSAKASLRAQHSIWQLKRAIFKVNDFILD
jgi:hypothetical protein